MKRPTDLGRKFLHLSDRDIKVFEKLVDDQDIPDEPLGFHAQQAIEKCLKAVLAAHEIEFRKTHDLNQLLGLLEENALPEPPLREDIQRLNPFAVLLRYDFLETPVLDRSQTNKVVAAARRWAAKLIG